MQPSPYVQMVVTGLKGHRTIQVEKAQGRWENGAQPSWETRKQTLILLKGHLLENPNCQ